VLPYSYISIWLQKLRVFTVLLIVGMPLHSLAQWRAVTFQNILTDTIYDLKKDISLTKPVSLNFPEYFAFEKPPASGIVIPSGDKSSGRNTFFWLKPLKIQVDPVKDTLAIRQIVFCDNIRAYSIFLYAAPRHSWFGIRNEVDYQGFQEPAMFKTWQFQEIKDSAKAAMLNASIPISAKGQSLFVYQTENDPVEARFIFGELTIGHFERREVKVETPFFDSLIRQSARRTCPAPPFVSEYAGDVPPSFKNTTLNGYIEIKGDGGNEIDLLKKTILLCLQRYPYYKEYGVDKATAIAEFLSVWDSHVRSSSCDLLDAIASFIESRFQDGHFRLMVSNGCKIKQNADVRVSSPVRIYAIGDSMYVAAVLDTLYHLSPGSLVVEIDHRPARALIDSLRAALGGPNKDAQRKWIAMDASVLLERGRTDSLLLTYLEANGERSAWLKFNRRLNIPPNFRPIHAELRSYEDNRIAYFRINSWFPDVYLRLSNDWKTIDSAGALIIDLRGNGGGELFSGMRVFSLFIDKPMPFAISEDLNTHSRNSVIIRPNPLYHFPVSRPVIILGDANTACASESFIYGMKQLPNVTYVSADDRTAGMVAFRYDIHFPSGFYLINDAITGFAVMPDGNNIEHRGIKPDVKVDIRSVFDLRPYQDKVLQTAISISKRQVGISVTN